MANVVSISFLYHLFFPNHCLHCLSSLSRGVGCIFYEMITGRPLFPGSTVEDELHLIFRVLGGTHAESTLVLYIIPDFMCVRLWTLHTTHNCGLIHSFFFITGTPTEKTWPGMPTSEEFKTYNFPLYRAEPLVNHAPRYAEIDAHGWHVISKILKW